MFMRYGQDRPVTGAAEWTFSDAWLLTAIGKFGRRGCSLSEMIGSADALNHDIPTETQAAESLGRLLAANLVVVRSGRYRVSASGRAIYKRRQGGMFQLSGSVLAVLVSVPCADGKLEFAPGEFRAAYDEYARR
jgi:hypothetical protein